MGRRKEKKKGAIPTKRSWTERFASDVVSEPQNDPSLRELAMQNKAGVVGLGLGLLQMAGHGLWITIVVVLSQSEEAAQKLDSDSPLAWLIVIILAGSLVLTGLGLFVSLFYGLRKSPRLPAVIGFFLSFFTGVLATALVFMQAIRAMSK